MLTDFMFHQCYTTASWLSQEAIHPIAPEPGTRDHLYRLCFSSLSRTRCALRSCFYLSVRTFRSPSVLSGLSPRLKFAGKFLVPSFSSQSIVHSLPSASSQARPAPKPVPSHTGKALLLNSSTENMTPKEKPRPERITNEESARSHCIRC